MMETRVFDLPVVSRAPPLPRLWKYRDDLPRPESARPFGEPGGRLVFAYRQEPGWQRTGALVTWTRPGEFIVWMRGGIAIGRGD